MMKSHIKLSLLTLMAVQASVIIATSIEYTKEATIPYRHEYGKSQLPGNFEMLNLSPEVLDPIKPAASHHHKSGSKGWLDMGAWTKKKGAFGWYADFPVGGKGKR